MDRFPSLDRIDRLILGELQKNGRLTNKELSARVHLAPSSCHARTRRLEDLGAIRGYHARVDPAALGIGLRTLVLVRMADHAEKRTDPVQDFLGSLPEVVDIFHVAGQDDLVLHVAVRDTEHLRQLNLDTIAARPEVADLHTLLIFEHRRADGFPDVTDS